MASLQDLFTKRQSPNWCPGCGDHGILAALKQAVVNLGLEPEKMAIATGIGCGSKINQWIETYGFAALHGRSVPVAMGIELANPSLTVIAASGDGDGYGIGMGHFINTMRRNLNITYIVQDNQTYGLTLGQASPTSAKGTKGPSTPHGVIEEPVNPIRLALSSDCTFVARGFAGDIPHLAWLITEGVKHKGFSLIDVFQPCATFNKINTHQYFRDRVYKLQDDSGYDVSDIGEAFMRAGELGSRIPIGIFYKVEKPTYEYIDKGLNSELCKSFGGCPSKIDISDIDIGEVMESFM